MRRLTPLQRAYLLGLRRGLNRGRAEMRSVAEHWETEVCELQDDYETLIDELRAGHQASSRRTRDDARYGAQLSAPEAARLATVAPKRS